MKTPIDKLKLARERMEAIKLDRSRLAAEARDAGISQAEIALALGLTRPRVTQLLKAWDAGRRGPVDKKTNQPSQPPGTLPKARPSRVYDFEVWVETGNPLEARMLGTVRAIGPAQAFKLANAMFGPESFGRHYSLSPASKSEVPDGR